MSSDSYYRRCLQILADPHADYRKMLYDIAVTRPSALVFVVDGPVCQSLEPQWVDELKKRCVDLLKDHRKIEAIRLWRNTTGESLNDSKAAVEKLPVPE